MSIKIKRNDDWYIMDLERTDYRVDTAVVVSKNQTLHVYQNGKYVGVCEKKGRCHINKKLVRGLKKGVGSKLYKDIGLRFTHDNQAVVYAAKNKPLKRLNGKIVKLNIVVKAVPFIEDMRVLDNFVVETNLRLDREGILLYVTSFEKAMTNIIEQTLTENAQLIKGSKWKCPSEKRAKGSNKELIALLKERLDEMFFRLGMGVHLTFSAR